MENLITIILTSTVVSTIVSAIVIYRNNERTLQLKYVTEDRQKWREKMKDIFTEFIHSDKENQKKLFTKIRFNLNPKNPYDKDILEVMRKVISSSQSNSDLIKDLELRIQVLFKCEWEKAKREAGILKNETESSSADDDPYSLYNELKKIN